MIPVFAWDLAASDCGLSSYGDTAQWEWGVASAGPGGGPLWSTGLDGSYLNDSRDSLEITLPDLDGLGRPVLVFSHWYALDLGDYGTLEVRDDATSWTAVSPMYGYPLPGGFSGESGEFVEDAVDLSGLGTGARARFVFSADESGSAEGWYVDRLALYDGDAVAPRIMPLTIPTDTQDVEAPYAVRLEVRDDVQLVDVTVHAAIGGVAVEIPAAPVSGGEYVANIPAQGPGTEISWYATASDGVQTTRWPTTGEQQFRVYLPAPSDLSGPEGRIVDSWVRLVWDSPVSSTPIVGYRVVEVGYETLPIEVIATEAEVPVRESGLHEFKVAAVYDVGHGDWSDPLELEIEVPALAQVQPLRAYAGDQIHLSLAGESLYLLEGSSTLSLGDDIEVEEFRVVDVSTGEALIRVDEDAVLGTRAITLTGAYGTYTFPSEFEIAASDGTEHVVTAAPASAVQGFEGSIVFDVGEPFAGPVTVETDDDLLVTAVEIDEDRATVDLVVAPRASTGPHLVRLDDGVQWWVVELDVTESMPPTQRACNTGVPVHGGQVAFAGLLAVLAGRRNRRV